MNFFIGTGTSDDQRRRELYSGSIIVHKPCTGALNLCKLAADMVEEAFRPFNPRIIQEHIAPQQAAAILSELKPKFIHHPKSKEYVRQMLSELGCDLEKTYFDVPRLRSAFPEDYLTSGIAYAFHPHRDTWYSAPFCQINWWMPVYPINSENCMAIHPRYWSEPIRNGSSQYNYHKWNLECRHNAVQFVKSDTRVQPKPEQPIELEPQVRLICEPGAAYQFSAAQLHSTVPNTSNLTRYSIDFRTVHLDDVWSRTGAPNIDAACTGTTMGDYLKGTDLSHLPDEAIAMYQDGTELLYRPSLTPQQSANGVAS